MGIEITEPRVIVCEGPADVAFFKHLIRTRNLPPFDVQSADGKAKYTQLLEALSAASRFDRISGMLVVGDNDLDPPAAFRNIQEQIQAANGYGVPERPGEPMKSQGFPAVVVMMIPLEERSGCLETLLIEAIYEISPHLKPCVDAYATCTHADEWNEVQQAKMKLQSLISALCKSDPQTALRYAWNRPEEIIPLDRTPFDQIANFLSQFDQLVHQA